MLQAQIAGANCSTTFCLESIAGRLLKLNRQRSGISPSRRAPSAQKTPSWFMNFIMVLSLTRNPVPRIHDNPTALFEGDWSIVISLIPASSQYSWTSIGCSLLMVRNQDQGTAMSGTPARCNLTRVPGTTEVQPDIFIGRLQTGGGFLSVNPR
jgi:hypothetical protein